MRNYVLNFIIRHKELVWALTFAIVVDVFSIGSFIRRAIRLLLNKLSELSVAYLRHRIRVLEQIRDRLVIYTSSDKALYLGTLRLVLGVLVLMEAGAILLVFDHLDIAPHLTMFRPQTYTVFGVMCFTASIGIGIQGLRLSSLDTKVKLSEMIATADEQISALKAKLDARTK
jgi:hypothetical protein